MLARSPSEGLGEVADSALELAYFIDHVYGQTNRPGLVSNAAGDTLTNPPVGVGAEAITALGIKTFGSPNEADIAFLNKVEEGNAPVDIFFGDADN